MLSVSEPSRANGSTSVRPQPLPAVNEALPAADSFIHLRLGFSSLHLFFLASFYQDSVTEECARWFRPQEPVLQLSPFQVYSSVRCVCTAGVESNRVLLSNRFEVFVLRCLHFTLLQCDSGHDETPVWFMTAYSALLMIKPAVLDRLTTSLEENQSSAEAPSGVRATKDTFALLFE